MKLCCLTLSYRRTFQAGKMDIWSFIEECRRLDLDGVDLHHDALVSTDEPYLRKVKRACLDRGLSISCFSISTSFGVAKDRQADALEKYKKWLRVAQYFGAPVARLFAGAPADEADREPAFQRSVECLRAMSEYAESLGVVAALQNHNHGALCRTGDDVLDLSAVTAAVTFDLNTQNATRATTGGFTLGINLQDGAGGNGTANFENIVGSSTAANSLTGNAAGNSLTGGAAADTIRGGASSDTATGGAGNDMYVFVDTAANTVDVVNESAGAETDVVDLSAVTAAVTFDLNTQNATRATTGGFTLGINLQDGAGGNGTANFENVIGGATATNTLTGNAAANSLTGGAAADTLSGGAGNDSITGGAGSDSLVGGNGDDSYMFADPTTAETDTINEVTLAGSGNDTMDFRMSSVAATVNLKNTSGSSHLATQGTSPVRTIDGTTKASLETVLGGTGSDNFTADSKGTQINHLDGGLGGDTLSAGGGNDMLVGGSGNDCVLGGKGNDTLFADSGADTLRGDKGDDRLEAGSCDAAIDSFDGGKNTDTLVGGLDSQDLAPVKIEFDLRTAC